MIEQIESHGVQVAVASLNEIVLNRVEDGRNERVEERVSEGPLLTDGMPLTGIKQEIDHSDEDLYKFSHYYKGEFRNFLWTVKDKCLAQDRLETKLNRE